MSWQDRLREQITLISPQGQTYEAAWSGNPIEINKRVPLFNYPNISGTFSQDLGIEGHRQTITIRFHGPDHDLDAQSFIAAMAQRGPWRVIHPVNGDMLLQPLSLTPQIQPVESANVTEISTEWIDFKEEVQHQSLSEVSAEVRQVSLDAGQEAANEFAQKATDRSGIIGEVQKRIGRAGQFVRGLAKEVNDINSRYEQAIRSITAVIEEPLIDTLALAGGIRNFMNLPALANRDINSRISAFTSVLGDITQDISQGTSEEDITRAAVVEIMGNSAVQAMAETAITSDFQSREEALNAAQRIIDNFDSYTASMEQIQERFASERITRKYIFSELSYAQLSLMTALAIRYIFRASFDLSVEKRIVLDRPRSPIAMTIEEYGSLGANDENFDLFILSNNLNTNETFLMPAGREVVVFVDRGAG